MSHPQKDLTLLPFLLTFNHTVLLSEIPLFMCLLLAFLLSPSVERTHSITELIFSDFLCAVGPVG